MEEICKIKEILEQYEKVMNDKATIQNININEKLKESVYKDLQSSCFNKKRKLLELIILLPEVVMLDDEPKKEEINIEKIVENVKHNNRVDEQYKKWKDEVSHKIIEIYDRDMSYIESKNILKELYEYMTNVYGIVWEQDFKEWRRTYIGVPRTLEIIYNNSTYKSIFDSILNDKHDKAIKLHPEKITVKEIIEPLIIKKQDKSNGGCATLKKIYSLMSETYDIDWDKWMKRYQKETGITVSSKSELLYWNHGLVERFRIIVNDLIQK